MAPTSSASLLLAETEIVSPIKQRQSVSQYSTNAVFQKQNTVDNVTRPENYRVQLVWRNVIAFIILHSITIYALLFLSVSSYTAFFTLLLGLLGALGVTAGAHRLWAHRCYKAKWPMRLILMLFQTLAFQNHIYEWVRDHRVHHKFTDTNADPHNSKRGFFFCHMGWLIMRKHPDVFSKGKTIELRDLEQDPIVMFQKKYYLPLIIMITFVMPTYIPYYFWNEPLNVSFMIAIVRYILSLHGTWLVNSAAHMWGMKPYDKTISAVENLPVAALALGEGFHNYHHAFPWDYKAAELGDYTLNLTTAVIDAFAKIGMAYDMKMANPEMVVQRCRRTGDGSKSPGSDVWGWDDNDMTNDEKKLATILHAENAAQTVSS